MFGDVDQFYNRLENALSDLEESGKESRYIHSQHLPSKHNDILKMVSEYLEESKGINNAVEILKSDNRRLTNKFNNEKLKCHALQQKLKSILKNQELFAKMKEEYEAMSKSIKARNLNEDKSANDLTKRMEISVQTCMECPHCLEKKTNLSIASRVDSGSQTEASIVCQVKELEVNHVPRGEIDRLQDDINTLKELLNAREIIWGKLATRERVQRLQLNRLHDELEDFHQVELKQKVEIELKNQRLQEMTKDLEREKLQVRKLKKHVTKLEGHDKVFPKLRERLTEIQQKEANVHAEREGSSRIKLKH